MPVGEGLDRTTGEDQHAYWPSLPHQRHAQKSTSFADLQRFNESELWVALDVVDLYGATLKHNPTNYVPSVNGEWMAVKIFRELRGEAVARDTMIPFAFG
jgi:hypothetical protein